MKWISVRRIQKNPVPSDGKEVYVILIQLNNIYKF